MATETPFTIPALQLQEGGAEALQCTALEVSPALHAGTRARLLEELQARAEQPLERTVLFFEGMHPVARGNSDWEVFFRQESCFWYLFGCEDEGCNAVIEADTGRTTLFVRRMGKEYAIWMGASPSAEELREKYGVDELRYVGEEQEVVQALDPARVLVLNGTNSDSGAKYPRTSIESDTHPLRSLVSLIDDESTLLYDALVAARMRKTEEEVQVLAYINRVSSDAHMHVLRNCSVGMVEQQLEAIFRFYCHMFGCARLSAYSPIVGSGSNAAILHYGHAGAPNTRRMEDGDLVLCDMGNEMHCYASDITLTFPVNGTFTVEQRFVYETVRIMQRAVLAKMAPGVVWFDMHALVYRIMAHRFLERGIFKGDADTILEKNIPSFFMPHGLGHYMGLDTHDVGGYSQAGEERDTRRGFCSLRTRSPLVVGNVVTVEPGVYFQQVLLDDIRADPDVAQHVDFDVLQDFVSTGGVRLEDNVLVVEGGIRNLTYVPRSVEEVEAVMRGEITNREQLTAFRNLYPEYPLPDYAC